MLPQLPDGAGALLVDIDTRPNPVLYVGGNCSIQGFDYHGNDMFWTVSCVVHVLASIHLYISMCVYIMCCFFFVYSVFACVCVCVICEGPYLLFHRLLVIMCAHLLFVTSMVMERMRYILCSRVLVIKLMCLDEYKT